MYEKGLAFDLVPPPGGNVKSPRVPTINPIGKILTLDADGTIESDRERPSVKEALGEQMAALEAFQIEVLGEQMAAIEAILGALR